MAKMKEAVTLKFQTTKDAEVEQTSFKPGDEVKIVQEWGNSILVRAADGHYYNVPKDKIDK
ncbi:MAG: hypothetical protein ACAI38_11505 [Myxococcota bacterium]|nr:hypothetical protein [Myxococcota bacterium]